jgi:transcriptional regulator with PAS, ATPase and Fis domain
MPLEQQAMLLRAIQEKAILRVGGDTLINVDVRIIAATNQDLLELVKQGRFRADLYYRLNVIQISVPPLRERPDDIKLLFDYFLKGMYLKFSTSIPQVDPAVLKCLEKYSWPGNTRELQNMVERILLMAEGGPITLECLPREIVNEALGHSGNRRETGSAMSGPAKVPADRKTRKLYALEQEKESILKALEIHGGNMSRTAAELGISRNTLYRKLKNHNIVN